MDSQPGAPAPLDLSGWAAAAMDSEPTAPGLVDLSGSMAAMQLAVPAPPSPVGAAVDLPSSSMSAMPLDERYAILRGIAEECIEEDELLELPRKNPNPICYDGFEPSGRMHIAQGVVKAININKMINCGCKVKVLIGDRFAMLNKKLGGNLDEIRTVGLYMIEVGKALGVKTDEVEFVWSNIRASK